MKWYYAQGEVRQGPFEEPEFENLVREGVVTSSTLVWREGMATWQPYETLLVPAGEEEQSVATAETFPGAGGTTARATGPIRVRLSSARCDHCGKTLPAEEIVRLRGVAVCAECKPWALQSLQEGAPLDDGSEQIRKDHISHEASIKSVGLLYFLGSFFLVLVGVVLMFAPQDALPRLMGVAFVLVGGVQFWTGMGLRKLTPWSRIVAGVLSGIGLMAFGLGTIINAYILYLLLSKKGSMVFSDRYKQVIARTPHVKYKTSIIVWILLGLLVLILMFAMVGIFLAPRH